MSWAVAGGGTGGHAYPALAVAERLRERVDTELVYYGTADGPERSLAEEQEIDYRVVPAAQFRGRSPVRITRGAWNLYRGSKVARNWFRQDPPDAVFATGGYGAAPIGRARYLGVVRTSILQPAPRGRGHAAAATHGR